MKQEYIYTNKQLIFIDYLVNSSINGKKQIPPLSELSHELGMSIASLREQLELARTLGLIEAQPRVGIHIQPYSFTPSVIKSLIFAIKLDKSYFEKYSTLRIHLEKAYFPEAVSLLEQDDIEQMKSLIFKATEKLNGNPIQVPHPEHKQFHLMIYKRINNEFVTGLLESYWLMYEKVGLDLYSDLSYLLTVWDYHQRIVATIQSGEFDISYQLLLDHMELINKR